MIKLIQTIIGQYADKFAHFGMSGMLYLILYTFTKNNKVAIILVLAIGFFKEFLDFLSHHAELGDIVANVLGIVIAYYCVKFIIG